MVEAPSAAQAARGLHGSGDGCQQSHELPGRAVQVIDIREAGEPEAGRECAYGERDAASQRLVPQLEYVRAGDVRAEKHDIYNCRTLGSAGGRLHPAEWAALSSIGKDC